ncbi:hypothetical protein [Staphylococcus xylosus]|nr:hypothetical protein [Staphylococcus xylosus]
MKKLIMYFKKKHNLVVEILALRETITQITKVNHNLYDKIVELEEINK